MPIAARFAQTAATSRSDAGGEETRAHVGGQVLVVGRVGGHQSRVEAREGLEPVLGRHQRPYADDQLRHGQRHGDANPNPTLDLWFHESTVRPSGLAFQANQVSERQTTWTSCWMSDRAGHEPLRLSRQFVGPSSTAGSCQERGCPSSRALAGELGCARATVVAAYEQLVAEGYLLAEGGSGTTVASVRSTLPSREVASSTPIFTELIPGEPDPSSFPRQAWAAALRKVLHTHPDSVLGYGDRQGLAELRRRAGLVPGSIAFSGGRSVARRDLRELRVGAVSAGVDPPSPRCQPHRRGGSGTAAAPKGDRSRRTHDRSGTRRR